MRELSTRWEKNTSDQSPHESENSKEDNAEFRFGSKGNILPMLQSVDPCSSANFDRSFLGSFGAPSQQVASRSTEHYR